jgi:hypothetical protein
MKKLSELIREGAKLRPQYFGSYFGFRKDDPDTLCSCALGAAYEAAGAPMETYLNPEGASCNWRSPADVFTEAVGYDPNNTQISGTWIESLVSRWNDLDRLPREEIADRLEALGL